MDCDKSKPDWAIPAATALLRWGLGVLFIFASLGKFYYQGKWSFENAKWFVTGYLLEDKLRESFLPKFLIAAYGYALPYVEIILGVLLLTGIARNKVLFAAGLLMLTLIVGAMQAKD
ncbi:MAG: MauE/DoxX family redox-associated membrane protein, partial [Limisphaerales bacterium]